MQWSWAIWISLDSAFVSLEYWVWVWRCADQRMAWAPYEGKREEADPFAWDWDWDWDSVAEQTQVYLRYLPCCYLLTYLVTHCSHATVGIASQASQPTMPCQMSKVYISRQSVSLAHVLGPISDWPPQTTDCFVLLIGLLSIIYT